MSGVLCGFARTEITPACQGVFMDGFGFRLTPADGARDGLFACAAYFSHGETRFAIISLDVCALTKPVYEILCFHITNLSGVSADELALCATHTHSGPSAGLLLGLPISLDYWHGVGEALGKLICRARDGARCAVMAAGRAGELPYAENRRGGELLSRTLRAISVKSDDGGFALVHAACHPVILRGQMFSADYPGELCRRAPQTMFLQGCSGDVRPCFDGELTAAQKLEALGGFIAERVTRFCADARHAPTDILEHARFELDIPMLPFDGDGRLCERIGAAAADYYDEKEPVRRHLALQQLVYLLEMRQRRERGESPNIRAFGQIVRLGGAALVFLPFETLSETGASIETYIERLGARRELIFIIGCANAVYGYLAPRSEIARGGYEVAESPAWIGTSGCCERSESALLRAVYGAADKIYREEKL